MITRLIRVFALGFVLTACKSEVKNCDKIIERATRLSTIPEVCSKHATLDSLEHAKLLLPMKSQDSAFLAYKILSSLKPRWGQDRDFDSLFVMSLARLTEIDPLDPSRGWKLLERYQREYAKEYAFNYVIGSLLKKIEQALEKQYPKDSAEFWELKPKDPPLAYILAWSEHNRLSLFIAIRDRLDSLNTGNSVWKLRRARVTKQIMMLCPPEDCDVYRESETVLQAYSDYFQSNEYLEAAEFAKLIWPNNVQEVPILKRKSGKRRSV